MSPYHFSAMSLVRAAGQVVLEAVAGVSRGSIVGVQGVRVPPLQRRRPGVAICNEGSGPVLRVS
jgi:hypothetical protein